MYDGGNSVCSAANIKSRIMHMLVVLLVDLSKGERKFPMKRVPEFVSWRLILSRHSSAEQFVPWEPIRAAYQTALTSHRIPVLSPRSEKAGGRRAFPHRGIGWCSLAFLYLRSSNDSFSYIPETFG